MESNNRLESIIKDLENISPLALPAYLEQCEFYDMEDSLETLEKAVKEFEDKGGVSANLTDNIFTGVGNSILLILAKKFHEKTYKLLVKGKINTASIIKKMISFKYPEKFLNAYQYTPSSFTHDRLRSGVSGIDQEYNQKNYRSPGGKRNTEFKEQSFSKGNTTSDVTGRTVTNQGDVHRSEKGEADHIKPLQRIHNEFGSFNRRYSDDDSIKDIVNSNENFQLLAGDTNAAKGGARTNSEFIKYAEDIDKASDILNKPESSRTPDEKEFLTKKHLTDTQKKKAKLMAKEKAGHALTDDEKKDLEKYKLTDEAKENLREKEKEANSALNKKLLIEGSKTVIFEQIGRILEVMVGPISFEIKDSIKNGIKYGFDDCNTLEAFGKRIARAFKYLTKELPKLIGDLLGDLAQMFAHFLVSIIKVIRDFLGSFIDIVVSGFSVIIESVKVLSNKEMTPAEKGDAIIKLIVGFSTSILGQFVIEKLLNYIGVQGMMAEVISVLVSSIISALTVYLLNKMDLFALKDEKRYEFVKNVFDERKSKIKEDTAQFNIAVLESLKQKKIEHTKRVASFEEAIRNKDFELLNEEIDNLVQELSVDIPYSSTEDFINYIKTNESIYIHS